tara:strand:- start:113326 stop:113838 length:513 start_codon:yes stop_codon:yes gene_type:complete
MKTLKTLTILLLTLAIVSCNKDDGDSVGQTDPEVRFNATINGGTFTNYNSTLGFYDAGSSDGTLTLNITDANNNVIRIFLNSTDGLNGGVVKEVNNVDPNNFVTQVVIRDQAAMITYNSISGTITILESLVSAEDPDYRLVTGGFNIVASTNTGGDVTMIGNFEYFKYLQ